jgi:hypothetical protein
MSMSLRGDEAGLASSAVDARMHMHVVDKMLAKKKSLRDLFVRMSRDKDGRVPVAHLKDECVLRGLVHLGRAFPQRARTALTVVAFFVLDLFVPQDAKARHYAFPASA